MHSWHGQGQVRFQGTARYIIVASTVRLPLDPVPSHMNRVHSPTSCLIPLTCVLHISQRRSKGSASPVLHFVTGYLLQRKLVSPPAQPPSWRTTSNKLSRAAHSIHLQLHSSGEHLNPQPEDAACRGDKWAITFADIFSLTCTALLASVILIWAQIFKILITQFFLCHLSLLSSYV
jgi:hypothetical protein